MKLCHGVNVRVRVNARIVQVHFSYLSPLASSFEGRSKWGICDLVAPGVLVLISVMREKDVISIVFFDSNLLGKEGVVYFRERKIRATLIVSDDNAIGSLTTNSIHETRQSCWSISYHEGTASK